MLSNDVQYDTVCAKGKFLDTFLDDNTKYVLYALDMFFVEIKWDIKKMRSQAKDSLTQEI